MALTSGVGWVVMVHEGSQAGICNGRGAGIQQRQLERQTGAALGGTGRAWTGQGLAILTGWQVQGWKQPCGNWARKSAKWVQVITQHL